MKSDAYVSLERLMIRYLLPPIISLYLPNCIFKPKTPQSSKVVEVSEPAPPPPPGPALCNEGEYTPFVMEPISPMPSLENVRQLIPNAIGVFSPQPNQANIRLEVCLVRGEEVSLKGLTYLERAQQGEVKLVSPFGAIKGLKEALFGDISMLSLSFQDANFDYVLKGYEKDALAFVAMQRRHKSANSPTESALVGNLKFGDFPGSRVCDLGKELIPMRWEFERVTIDVEVCAWGYGLGTGTMYYEYNKLVIVDGSESLPANVRGQPVVLKKDQLANKEIFMFQQNHHNSCDAVNILLPHAEYALTGGETFTMGSGCLGFRNAPARTTQESDSDRESKSIYRVRRGNGVWVSGYFDRSRLVWQ